MFIPQASWLLCHVASIHLFPHEVGHCLPEGGLFWNLIIWCDQDKVWKLTDQSGQPGHYIQVNSRCHVYLSGTQCSEWCHILFFAANIPQISSKGMAEWKEVLLLVVSLTRIAVLRSDGQHGQKALGTCDSDIYISPCLWLCCLFNLQSVFSMFN